MASDANKKLTKAPSFADITATTNVPNEPARTASKSVSPAVPSRKEFKTDTDISKNRTRTDRVLEKWGTEGSGSTEVDLNKESSQRGGKTAWDQFAENERLFGVKTDFDEAHYTTPVGRDTLHPTEFKKRELEAERLAKEILTKSGTPMTVHVAEERGLLLPDDMDEEERYGSVARRVSIVSTEDHAVPPRKSSIASLGEKVQAGPQAASGLRRKSIVEQVSEDMSSAMKGILEDRQRRKSSLNPDAPEFSLNVNAPEYTPRTNYDYQQPSYGNNPYAQYQMPDCSDPEVMSAMMNAYYAYDPYAMNAYYAAAYQQSAVDSTVGPSMPYQQEGIYNPNAYYRPYRQPYVQGGGSHRRDPQGTTTNGSHDNLNDLAPATNSSQ